MQILWLRWSETKWPWSIANVAVSHTDFFAAKGNGLFAKRRPSVLQHHFTPAWQNFLPQTLLHFGEFREAGRSDFSDAGGLVLKFGKICADEHNIAAG